MNLVRGQKIKIQDITQSLSNIQVGIKIDFGRQVSIDIACFGVDQNDKLSDDRYFIFYNQPNSPENAVRKRGQVLGDSERFELNLTKLPSSIKKLVFTAAIDGNEVMSQISSGFIRLLSDNNEVARFSFSGTDFASEKAIILGEMYFKDIWRFSAVGQGFNGGLSALLKHFGGEELAPSSSPKPSQPTPQPPTPSPPSPPALPPKITLTKITLEKRGDKKTVDLRKKGDIQPIHINLNWDQSIKQQGFFGSKTIQADLDLGCMFLLKDGMIGVIQALGRSFGSRNDTPFIYLDKDDRSGQASDGENLYILRPDLITKVLIFTFIYEGTANFTVVNGRVTIKDELGNEIFMKLNNPNASRTFCAVCTIQNIGDKIEITKEEKYFFGHKDADQHYGFGFRWVAGAK
ncbi:MAG: TerD family protein [Desulfobacterales bacterium]|nr:TerD family protein [Desulfobacterales bacterium]